MVVHSADSVAFEAVLNNARGIGVKPGAQIEREYEREQNRSVRQCSNGHRLTYKHSIGAWKCKHGSLYHGNGTEIRGCR